MGPRRLDRRQGFLLSATIHLMILTLLAAEAKTPRRDAAPEGQPPPPAAAPEPQRRVLLLPPRLVPPPPPPPPPAPPREGKSRISIGPPSDQRATGPLLLERDKPLDSRPAGPQGPAMAGPPGAAPTAAPTPQSRMAEGGASGPVGTQGPGTAPEPRGSQPRSIGRSLQELDRRLGQMGTGSTPGGAGRQMGPLFFDPEGADFTAWTNHFTAEVYRNWIVPQAARFGFRGGHVDMEFWVERDGRITGLRLIKSSGTAALDRAAQNALTGSRLLPLPEDYAPPRVRIQVAFYYGEGPRG